MGYGSEGNPDEMNLNSQPEKISVQKLGLEQQAISPIVTTAGGTTKQDVGKTISKRGDIQKRGPYIKEGIVYDEEAFHHSYFSISIWSVPAL